LSFTKIKSGKRLLSSFGNFNSCEYPDISYTVSLSLLCVCVCVCVVKGQGKPLRIMTGWS